MRRVGACTVGLILVLIGARLVERQSSAGSSSITFSGGTLTQDTTLTPADSPYLITEDIVVPAGIELNLDPGTILELTPGRSIFVEGKLTAEGTSTQPITLTHDREGTHWGAVGFWRTSADNRLAHVIVEYTGVAAYYNQTISGLAAMTSTLTIEQSDIRHALSSAVTFMDATGAIRDSQVHDVQGSGNIDGIHVVRGQVDIERNRVYDGHDYFDAIDVDGDGTTGGKIYRNVIHGSSNDCIDLHLAATRIEANYIFDCADKGISLGVAASPVVVNNLIYRSAIGLASKDNSRPVLINNTIVSNTVGLALYRTVTASPGYATVHNSIIWDNDTTIQLLHGAEITITHSDVQMTTVWPGEGNINADPQFRAAAAFDYRLLPASPCTDTADASVAPATDIQGISRPRDGGVDMGAFEFFEHAWVYLPLIRR